ncbi:hypothetical protein AgCh_022654 [Apium graveolens]
MGQTQQSDDPGADSPPAGGQETAISRHITIYRQDRRDLGRQPDWELEDPYRKSIGKTFKVTLDGRIQAIQEESQQFLNPNEVVPPESNEQQ